MTFWRQVGLNYVQYSQICARAVRQCLKANLKNEAMRRDIGTIRATMWKDGKPVEKKK